MVARTYALYLVPVSITEVAQVRKRDVVDDETYKLMQNLVQMTKAVE